MNPTAAIAPHVQSAVRSKTTASRAKSGRQVTAPTAQSTAISSVGVSSAGARFKLVE